MNKTLIASILAFNEFYLLDYESCYIPKMAKTQLCTILIK